MMLRILLLSYLGLVLAACSASSTPQDLTERDRLTHPGVARGIVSGAQAEFDAGSGYKVTASAGYFAGGIYKETKGYKVYTSLSGALSADTYEEVIK